MSTQPFDPTNYKANQRQEWDMVAEAARRAAIGEGLKVKGEEKVLTLVTRDSHYKDEC